MADEIEPDPLPEEAVEKGLRQAFAADWTAAGEGLSLLARLGLGGSKDGPSNEWPRPERGNYRVLDELARGGMGQILRGYDDDLDREVALKVMHGERAGEPEILRRFVEEAQIGGQLQHPGVVPVYELGMMDDRRPFFAMKLVEGRSLAELLAARKSPEHDLARHLGIFLQVCHTIAFAHSRGIVHRDLKPANVMVGAFGEVQVVDWGLAKVLRADGAETGDDEDGTRASTGRASPTSVAHSTTGTVMGTLRYMPPEQASGEVHRIDARADVFALGAVLCELLTGDPPYRGEREDLHERVARADLDDARALLREPGVDPELSKLTLDCLAPEPEARPSNAGAVAQRLEDHLAAVEERRRAAELSAAAARGRALEERRARRLTVALAVSAVVVIGVGSAVALRLQSQRAHRRAVLSATVDQALDDARAASVRAASAGVALSWQEAVAAVERAAGALESGDATPELRRRVEEVARDVHRQAEEARAREQSERADRDLMRALEEVRVPEKLHNLATGRAHYPTDWGILDGRYAAAFEAAGFDFFDHSVEEGLAALRERAVAQELVVPLLEWADARRRAGRDDGVLTQLAAELDTDPVRRDLIASAVSGDTATLEALAEEHDVLPAGTAVLLASEMRRIGGRMDRVQEILRNAQAREPNDFAVNLRLANSLALSSPEGDEEALRFYTAALALRPESIEVRHATGLVLERLKRYGEAEKLYRESLERAPDDGHLLGHLGRCLMHAERWPEAERACARATELEPEAGLHWINLGFVLHRQGDREGAEIAWRAGVELEPTNVDAHVNLALLYEELGRSADCIEMCERGLELAPERVGLWRKLGQAHSRAGDLVEAASAYRRATEINPVDASAQNDLGVALFQLGVPRDALEFLERAVELNPDFARAHLNLALTLESIDREEEAEAHFARVRELDPALLGSRR